MIRFLKHFWPFLYLLIKILLLCYLYINVEILEALVALIEFKNIIKYYDYHALSDVI